MSAHTRTADIQTPHGSRYLQQLCKHWSHKAAAEFTPQAGRVTFETWNVGMAATPQTLSVTVTVKNAEDAARIQTVVAEHLQRFATQETLGFDWR